MKLRASQDFNHTAAPLLQIGGWCTLVALLIVPVLAEQDTVASSPAFRDGVVLVGFEPGVSPGRMAVAAVEVGAVDVETIGASTHVLRVSPGRVTDTIHALRRNPEVRYAEPDYLVWPAGVPNDTNFNLQWGFQNTGQKVNGVTGTAGADERSVSAWNVTTGSAGANAVVVAVADTGVQYNHPDLETNMWSNPGTIGNCPAGTNGFNVLNQTCNPMDDDTLYGGHGTHIAGILGAATNNANGVAGVNWTVQIMAVKWIPASTQGTTSNLISALQWVINAKKAGVNVRVVNDSGTWTGTAFSQALSDEIDLLGSNDILFVVAAGNTVQNNDTTPRYPCSYARANQICVAATDQNDNLWNVSSTLGSNWGINTVDLAAPGANIYSTKRATNYGFISGTSMSAGEVSGAAALILSQGYQSVANLKSMILNNVDPLPSLTGLVRTGGRLNVCNAIPGCATATTALPANTVAPLVVSTAQFGHQVGAWTGSWSGSPTSFSHQWSRCDSNGANCVPIVGATSSTYMALANADVGSTLEVSVTASNAMGTATVTSAPSPKVQAASASPWSVSSTILDGTTISGQVFWQATPSLPNSQVNNIQFYIDGSLKATDFSSPYNYNGNGTLDTTKMSQGPHVLALRGVKNSSPPSNAYYSTAVTVCNPPNNTGLPGISGTAKQGKTLNTGNGSWTLNPVSFAYQWNRCDSTGANCAAITGATANSYVLIDADVGSTIRAAVTATNQCGASSTATSNPTAVVQASAPTITTTSLPSGMQNVAYSTTLAATGGIQPYTWSIKAGTGNLPTGLSLNSSTGVISGTPTVAGTRSFTVQVTDANSMTASQALSITITNGVSITTTTLPAGEQNVAYSTTLAASGGTQPYTWSIPTGTPPGGLNLNSSTGVISGMPNASGTSNFTVQVTDANSLTATQALSITIAALPSITTTTLPAGTQNAAYSQTLAVSGGTQPYTWSITIGTLPTGLNLNSSTGVISGMPTVLGTSNFTVQVTDANSQSATQGLSITIATGLIVTTTTLPAGEQSVAYSTTLAASGGTQPYTWSITTGTLPSGLSLNTSTGVISGKPNVSGTSNFTVRVTDANSQTATQALSITIAPLPSVTTTTLPAGEQNVAYSTTLTASGGTQPYTWSITTGTPPGGLILNSSTGVISGTPTGSGTSNFTVQVTDANSLTATKGLSITIAPPPSITTTTLPGGTQNIAYSTTLPASGGTQPYTWSITIGTPPNGLSLNSSTGVISGTPTGSGTSNFTVQLTDANSQSATQALSITIAPVGAGIALVQSAAVQGSSVTSLSVAFPANNTAGNLIVVFVRATSGQTVTVTDTASNTYALAVSQVQTTNAHQIYIFYATSAANSSNTVTATFSGTNTKPWLAGFEYTGVSALDQTASAQGSGTAAASTGLTATTTSNNELVFAGLGLPSNAGTVTAGTGFQLLLQDVAPNLSRAATEAQIVSVTGQYAGTFSISGGTNWSAAVATFK